MGKAHTQRNISPLMSQREKLSAEAFIPKEQTNYQSLNHNIHEESDKKWGEKEEKFPKTIIFAVKLLTQLLTRRRK